MPDYGHPLRFGSFITPTSAPASRPGDLALLSEELGLDLVTFQDHPYQATFLDTWTLLTWVAARTERIHLAGNVLSLPLRQPAVLARAAASLDLLSNGRLSLGLGSGAFWDGIASMGGRRLSPGQAVAALSEGIDVIRGVLDVSQTRPLRIDGEYYQVNGVKRGPAPTHSIPIWIGAYKPKMLRLVTDERGHDLVVPGQGHRLVDQRGDIGDRLQSFDDRVRIGRVDQDHRLGVLLPAARRPENHLPGHAAVGRLDRRAPALQERDQVRDVERELGEGHLAHRLGLELERHPHTEVGPGPAHGPEQIRVLAL